MAYSFNPPRFGATLPNYAPFNLQFTEGGNARNEVRNVRDFVIGNINTQQGYANSARVSALETLTRLGEWTPTLQFDTPPPDSPVFDTAALDGPFDLPEITPTSFGGISINITPAPGLEDVRDPGAIDILPFLPSIDGLNIPNAPEPVAAWLVPESPELADVNIPAAPVIDKPVFPSLTQIEIPEFEFPTLPTFDAQSPEFEGTVFDAVINWVDVPFDPTILEAATDKVRSMMDGASGLTEEIEQALWDRDANRIDAAAAQETSEVYQDFASRGFSVPQGSTLARVDEIRKTAMLEKSKSSRDIAIRMAEMGVDNVKWAAEQSVAIDTLVFNVWNATAQRSFDMARAELDAKLSLYNAQVQLFNARQSAYSVEAQIYKVNIDAQLATIEVFKAQLEGELAKGQLNEQKVRIYGEQIRALLADVEVYKAVMQGAGLQSDVNRNKIETFKVQVQAFAEQIRADKTRFDAYESQVKGELGKAQILDAEARAYNSYVSGQSTIADIGIKQAETDIRNNELILRQYTAQLEGEKAQIMGQVEQIKASSGAYIADTQRYSAMAGAQEAKFKVQVAAKEAELRTGISLYEAEIRKYVADMELAIRTAQIQLEALKSTGQVASTIAAGAMAGINVGANLSGSGSLTAATQESMSLSQSNSYASQVSRSTALSNAQSSNWNSAQGNSHNININVDADSA